MYRRSKRNIINLLFSVKPETDPNSNYEQNLIRFCRRTQFNFNKNVTETMEVISFIVFLVICGSNILSYFFTAALWLKYCRYGVKPYTINQSINILIYIGSGLVYSYRFWCKIKKYIFCQFCQFISITFLNMLVVYFYYIKKKCWDVVSLDLKLSTISLMQIKIFISSLILR